MVHIRRTGLAIGAVVFLALLIAAFATEGLWLALIVVIGAFMVAAFVVPLLTVFEEERGLPAARAARKRY